ncbi:MAG: Cytoplasmic glyoxalase II [Stictis urceolatum]|nr:Cytoplasmic glyoxalase II [Stictis urceolata]
MPVLSQFKDLPVIGGKDCQVVTQTPANGETFKIGSGITVTALHTPCHTQDSICYFLEDGNDRAVFTGDTLFIGGCGRFFEGTAEEMDAALNKTLAALPDDTKVYPGHEYTKANVKFIETVLQTEPVQKLKAFATSNRETQGKFTIGDEKQYNVFMKLDDPAIQKATGKSDPVSVMAKLREMKNNVRQCLIYDSPKENARLIGIEYMISPRLYNDLPTSERKLWHSHKFEVKSGMLIMPTPTTVPRAIWEHAETKEMEDVISLYGKTYHLWQVDRGDIVPMGAPELMMSFTEETQLGECKKKWEDRDGRFAVESEAKADKRRYIKEPEIHPGNGPSYLVTDTS